MNLVVHISRAPIPATSQITYSLLDRLNLTIITSTLPKTAGVFHKMILAVCHERFRLNASIPSGASSASTVGSGTPAPALTP